MKSNKIKFFDTTINSLSKKFSIQPTIPEIDGKVQPMELLFVIEEDEGETLVMNFTKDQSNEILKELKRIVPLVECFG